MCLSASALKDFSRAIKGGQSLLVMGFCVFVCVLVDLRGGLNKRIRQRAGLFASGQCTNVL